MRRTIDGWIRRFRTSLVQEWRLWVLAIAILATAGVGAGWLNGYTSLRILAAIGALLLAVTDLKSVTARLLTNFVIVAFVVWSATTVFWAENSVEALTTLAGLVSVVLLAAVVSEIHDRDGVERLIIGLFTGTSLLSLVLVLAVPAISTVAVVHPTEGTLLQPIGVFNWNSDLGFSAGLAAALACAHFARERKWQFLVAVLVNVVVVGLSNSVASWIVLAAGLFVCLLTILPRVGLTLTSLAGLTIVTLGFMFGFAELWQQVFALVGRSPGLTGRTNLWELTLDQSQDTWWIGRGLGLSPDFTGISAAQHAHNGFIQLIFDRGIVGLALFCAIAILAIIGCAVYRRWALLIVLVMVLVANVGNDYATFASLGMFLFLWVSYSSGLQPGWTKRLRRRDSLTSV